MAPELNTDAIAQIRQQVEADGGQTKEAAIAERKTKAFDYGVQAFLGELGVSKDELAKVAGLQSGNELVPGLIDWMAKSAKQQQQPAA
jgi:hypothetical protein